MAAPRRKPIDSATLHLSDGTAVKVTVGETGVSIKLHREVVAEIKVTVAAEASEEAAAEAAPQAPAAEETAAAAE